MSGIMCIVNHNLLAFNFNFCNLRLNYRLWYVGILLTILLFFFLNDDLIHPSQSEL